MIGAWESQAGFSGSWHRCKDKRQLSSKLSKLPLGTLQSCPRACPTCLVLLLTLSAPLRHALN